MSKEYDYIVVGSGLFGATFARLATDMGKKILIIEKRGHIGGNCATYASHGIHVHAYGPHIFHCNDEKIWRFVNRFSSFNGFINTPIALSKGKVYTLPFCMYTFNQMWGVTTPESALLMLQSQQLKLSRPPENLEEQALVLVGRDIYENLIKEYTIKQWKKHPRDLPSAIIKRLPVRYTWNNNYFEDKYQGIPVDGYTAMFENMLDGIEVRKNIDFLCDRSFWISKANKVLFTGGIDMYYEYQFGDLEYRSLDFSTKVLDCENFQGNAVINYSDSNVPWTRVIEHKHFYPGGFKSEKTVITYETPILWDKDKEPYYPVESIKNRQVWNQYMLLSKTDSNVLFGGRLAEYRYYDMHQVIGSAFALAQKELNFKK